MHEEEESAMSESAQGGQRITGTVTGDVAGQVAIGSGIRQSWTVGAPAEPPTDAELAGFRQALEELRAQVAAAAPTPEVQAAAAERVSELEAAAIPAEGGEPDLTTMEYVKKWFVKNLPALAGSVTSLVVHPVVGKLVTAAGDAAVAEFNRRFGK
jgi:hypothetical protein